MIIGIDGNEANVEKKVGISEYAYQLLQQFSNSKFKIQNSKFSIYLKEEPIVDLPAESDNWQYRMVKPKKLWTQFGLPLDLYFHRPRPAVFFSPTHYAPRFSPVPTVISVMDLSYIHFPRLFKKSDLYQLRNWTSYSVKNAVKIFTISNASKDDIIEEYNIPKEKIVVTYPGIKNTNKKTMSQLEKNAVFTKYKINTPYILFVGTLQPRKNIERLIEAFAKLHKDQKNLTLVIVGKKGWLFEPILKSPEKYGVSKDVRFLEFVLDEELQILYKHALFFVLPSLYEGFGLPILEAMRQGCPVITSNVSSMPEAGGDAALYVDPKNTKDIVLKMTLLLTNSNKREELRKKGFEQVKKFSWEKSAEQTLAVLEEVAKGK